MAMSSLAVAVGTIVVSLLCGAVQRSHGQLPSDTSPKDFAKLVGDAIIAHKEIFFTWDYGGMIAFDGLWQANETFGLQYDEIISQYLDEYLQKKGSVAYKAAHGQALGFGTNIGDVTSMIPVPYLNRYQSYGSGPEKHPSYNGTVDLKVAHFTADTYILPWPRVLKDGTVARDRGWPGAPGSGHNFLWADDQFKAVIVPSRLSMLLDVSEANGAYVKFAAKQVMQFSQHTTSSLDGLYVHGYNDYDHQQSCCKWGRANGYSLFAKLETVAALTRYASLGQEYQQLAEKVKTLLNAQLKATVPFQSADGRWRQLTNVSNSFLETSSTAMFTTGLARSVRMNWTEPAGRSAMVTAAMKGYQGLLKTVNSTGAVSGICEGTEIQANATGYLSRPTEYLKSGDGGLGTLLMAAVEIQKLKEFLQGIHYAFDDHEAP